MSVLRFYCLLMVTTLAFIHLSCDEKEQEILQEVTIIGGGLMGSATAWHLSQRGIKVLLLEKQDSIYTQGSSHGTARIARSSNRGNDIWSFLHDRSVVETQILIDSLNAMDENAHASMEDIYTTTPVTYVGRMAIYDKLLASLIRQKVDFDLAINPQEALTRLGVRLPADVLIQREYNKYSGTVNPQQLIRLLHQAIRNLGGRIEYQTQVRSISYNPDSEGYLIEVENATQGTNSLIASKKVVCAAGPYTSRLTKNIAPYFDTLINPQRVFLSFLQIKPEVYHQLSAEHKEKIFQYYPVINSAEGTRSGSFFSMIEHVDQSGNPVIKIGGHFQRSSIEDLDKVWHKDLSAAEISWSIQNTSDYFELLNIPLDTSHLELVDQYSCVYSLTKSEVPFVTPIPDASGAPNRDFIVLGGMSGVGAKGAMTYGLIAANHLTNSHEDGPMYNEVRKAIGFERLSQDLGIKSPSN
ncbi:MAG: FAD-binding oxidoreductase [Saprospiraceae bacterium]|nr:FAD-binding oxidoreductase [Saprospiraceae bacterium]